MEELLLLAVAGLVFTAAVLNAKIKTLMQRVDKLERLSRSSTSAAPVEPITTPPVPSAEPPVPARAQPAAMTAAPSPVVVNREATRHAALGNRTVAEFLSENLLAIIGGLLVLAGAVFFLGLAISRGWIGETGRTLIALVAGAALTGAGWTLGRRLGASSPDRGGWAFGSLHGVVTGTGIAVLFLAVFVGTRVYDVFGYAGLPLALLVGAVATAIALRWRSPDLAAFGIGVGLAAPILVDAEPTLGTLAFVAIALAAALTVAVVTGWAWLLTVALVVTAPQIAEWSLGESAPVALLGVLVWTLALLSAALASELRSTPSRLRTSLATTMFLAASAAALIGSSAIGEGTTRIEAAHWLVALGLLHAAGAGVVWARRRSLADPLAVWSTLLAASLIAAAVAEAFDGAAVAWIWSAEAAGLYWLWARTADTRAAILAPVMGVLAVGHVLVLDAAPELLWKGAPTLAGPISGAAALVAASLAAAWISKSRWRDLCAIMAAGWATYGASIVVVSLVAPDVQRDPGAQLSLVAFWALVSLAALAVAPGRSRGRLSSFAGLGLATAAAAWWLSLLAWWSFISVDANGPRLFLDDAQQFASIALWPAGAVVAAALARYRSSLMGAVLAAGWLAVGLLVVLFQAELIELAFTTGSDNLELAGMAAALGVATAGVLLTCRRALAFDGLDPAQVSRVWIAAVAVVSACAAALLFLALSDAVLSSLTAGTHVEQDAQMALSILWGVLGVSGFVASASLRVPAQARKPLRVVCLALLGVAVGKVVLVDTQQLDSVFRVLVFVGLGLLLLVGAWLDQQLRRNRAV